MISTAVTFQDSQIPNVFLPLPSLDSPGGDCILNTGTTDL